MKPDAWDWVYKNWILETLSNFTGVKNTSDKVNVEFSKTTKQTVYESFFALIEPPSYFEKLYSKTIYGAQSRLTMLAWNIIKKSPNYFKSKAKQIFSKITSVISKKYHNESFEINTLKGKNKYFCQAQVQIQVHSRSILSHSNLFRFKIR